MGFSAVFDPTKEVQFLKKTKNKTILSKKLMPF